ncbi:MAG: exo-alpha-sialidase [Opitutaceae bacterium]|nr:exo-alpha-sialidase [Opitutaceae bacterium]
MPSRPAPLEIPRRPFRSGSWRGLACLAAVAGGLLAWTPAFAAPGTTGIVSVDFVGRRATTPQCHASTIVETASGRLVAAWFGGTHEKHPDVGIWVSRQVDGAWDDPVEVADGVQYRRADGSLVRHPTWNPVLFQPRDGPLFLFYKVGPSPQEWWGMLMTSDDDGRTWSQPRRLPEGILGPIKNKPIQRADGAWLCPSSTESAADGWRVHFELTRDLGRTWQVFGPVDRPPDFHAIQPSILEHRDGRLQLLARTKNDVLAMSWSSDQGATWSRLEPSGLPNPSSGTDAVTLADGRHVLVYNPTRRQPDGRGGPRTPLQVAVSEDGVRWTDVAVLETDDARHGYSYPAVIQTRDGRVHVTYTWRRLRVRHVVLDPAAFPRRS